MTGSRDILGTPAYMPPEQARGEAHRVDGRSDLYSLGVILYQMLTGTLPFLADSSQMVLKKVLEEEPQPPRRLNDRVPRPGDDLPEMPREGARPPLCLGRRDGRGPGAVLEGRADPRAARRKLERRALVPQKTGRRRLAVGGHGRPCILCMADRTFSSQL